MLITPLMRIRAAWKVRHIRPYLHGSTLLDAGAGDGWVGRRIARSLPINVTLLDVIDFNQTDLPLVRYDGRHLPFANDTFDTILLLTVLHHCEDPDRVLDECLRVSCHRLIVTESVYRTAFGRQLLTGLDRFFNCLRSGGAMHGPLQFRPAASWASAFEARGLRLVARRWLSRGLHKHVLFVLEKPGRNLPGK